MKYLILIYLYKIDINSYIYLIYCNKNIKYLNKIIVASIIFFSLDFANYAI